MKPLKPQRFGREEEINFQAEPITHQKPASAPKSPVDGQNRPQKSVSEPIVLRIVIPHKRARIRHAFDIFEDQLNALKTLQDSHRDLHGNAGTPSLSEMTREAFDEFIKTRVKTLKNINIFYE